ncbi:replication initiator protein A [Pseudomonas lactis]|uniref:replication initiator protein A n=1 Tax=Pseudomonas lactis TaxID=1615674 RepID=UPI00110C91D7|nr:replication initiator protein A [Pseudomonas lactis]
MCCIAVPRAPSLKKWQWSQEAIGCCANFRLRARCLCRTLTVTSGAKPDVLTVHRDYFLIGSGLGRFLYRLARRAAGKTDAKWAFKTIYEHSGSAGPFNKFCFKLREIIKANELPEYTLQEEAGQKGPLLVMRHKDVPDRLLEPVTGS